MPPPMLPPDTGMPVDAGMPPEVPTGEVATEDMVVIQLPRAQLQTVIQAFKEITGMLEAAGSKADSDIAASKEAPPVPPAGTDMNSPEALAAEISGMRQGM